MLNARAADGVKVAVLLDAAYVTTPSTATGGVPVVTVNVVLLMVSGFMGTLKVAVTTVLGQAPPAPVGGVSETAVGGTKAGLAPGLQHPVLTMSSRNAMKQSFSL